METNNVFIVVEEEAEIKSSKYEEQNSRYLFQFVETIANIVSIHHAKE